MIVSDVPNLFILEDIQITTLLKKCVCIFMMYFCCLIRKVDAMDGIEAHREM